MTDHDSPWKEILDCWIAEFLAFFFPHIHQAIDWSRDVESLDKEMQKIMPDAESGRRYVDKLIKVWRKDGVEEWVLIHIEIQHQHDEKFPRRMFVYYYRLLYRYNRKVASLAVLGDERKDWRPDRYNEELWGCGIDFRFPIVKLLDWDNKRQELENDANPFAVVVLADLMSRATQRDMASRKEWKFRIVRGLYERGLDADRIRQLFRFIEWVMQLPEPLAIEFDEELPTYEKEKTMPFITGIERRAIERGKTEGKIEGLLEAIEVQLESKFDAAGLALMPAIRAIGDAQRLKELLKAIKAAASVEDVAKLLP